MKALLTWVKSAVGDTVGKTISSAVKWAVIIISVLAVLSLHTWWKQKKELKRIRSHCSSAEEDTIFVVLIGECSTKTTAQSLFSVFEKASCPTRITVGLYEFLDHEDSVPGGALTLYRKMAQRHGSSGLNYESQIKVMARLKGDQGPYGAIWEVIQHSLKQEKYVFVVNDALQMMSAWDSLAVKSLEEAPDKSILVQHSTSSFPVLSKYKDNLPEIDFKLFHFPDSVEVSFWSRSSSFSSSEFWRDIPNKRKQFKRILSGVDVLISAEALHLGWKFYSTSTQYVSSLSSTKKWNIRSAEHEDLVKHLQQNYLHELRIMNVFPVDKKSLMGVCDEKNEQEINAKYGSVAEFLYQSGA